MRRRRKKGNEGSGKCQLIQTFNGFVINRVWVGEVCVNGIKLEAEKVQLLNQVLSCRSGGLGATLSIHLLPGNELYEP